jgi:hypothetical protein
VFRRGALLGLLAAPGLSCASAPPAKPDLEPARAAVERAREAGASERAPDEFARAQDHLKRAEAAAAEPGLAQQAACLAELTVATAECSVQLASAQSEAERQAAALGKPGESERLAAARLKKAEEEQRRLEERVAVLVRDLDLTETEVIRTKARLQGLETKADATSVVAETRVLIRRLQEQRGRSPAVHRSQELLERAEQMIEDGNFGAATFMALKAQELIKDARRGALVEEGHRPAPKRQYVVTASLANLRSEPSRDAPISGQLKKGDSVEATAQRGEWLHVKAGSVSGWVFRELVE